MVMLRQGVVCGMRLPRLARPEEARNHDPDSLGLIGKRLSDLLKKLDDRGWVGGGTVTRAIIVATLLFLQ